MVTSRQALAEKLANWPGGENDSWGMVFMGAVPSGTELAAAQEAAKLCDRVVGVVMKGHKGAVAPKMAETCRAAGCDVVWVPKEITGFAKVDVGVDGIDGTLMAQAVMSVLPMLVVAHRGEVALIRALRNFQGGLGEVFSLRLVG